jgi:hypothetical protein
MHEVRPMFEQRPVVASVITRIQTALRESERSWLPGPPLWLSNRPRDAVRFDVTCCP